MCRCQFESLTPAEAACRWQATQVLQQFPTCTSTNSAAQDMILLFVGRSKPAVHASPPRPILQRQELQHERAQVQRQAFLPLAEAEAGEEEQRRKLQDCQQHSSPAPQQWKVFMMCLRPCLQRQRAEQQAAQVLQQKAEVLDKVRHRFRRAIGNEDDEPEEEAEHAGALEDGKRQVSLHPCKAWQSTE